MKRFTILFLVSLLWSSAAGAACTLTNPTEQTCDYTLSWIWDQGDGAPADGFVLQRMADNNGVWFDVARVAVTERSSTDTIQNDKGGRALSWRLFAFNVVGRSDPSPTASTVTEAIVPADAVTITTRAGLIVNVSRRSTDTSSIVSVLVNQNEVLGAAGVEISYPPNKTLNVSRRAIDTSSIVSILVNNTQLVIVNGQAVGGLK